MRITAQNIIFSVNSFFAAMAALYISLLCDLERPYWAMMTAYIISQPFSGALHSKAVYRMLGTACGAGMMIFLVPTLSNAPVLLSFAIAVWIGTCLFISLLDRTPRSYIFLLAGFTTAFVGFPLVGAPQTAFEVGVARVEEICVGVLCATFFHTVFLPQNMHRFLSRRFQGVVSDLTLWCADTFARKKDAVRKKGRIRLAADITELHLAATHVPFDTHQPQQLAHVIAALEGRLIRLFPLITGLSDRFKRLEADGPLPDKLNLLLQQVREWIAQPIREESTAEMEHKCRSLQPLSGAPSWREMLLYNIGTRLGDFVNSYAACHRFAALVGNRESIRGVALEKGELSRLLHTDRAAAAYSAIVCVAIVFVGSLLWIMSGWPEGSWAVMMGTVIYCISASQPDPVPMQRGALIYTTIAMAIGTLYVFIILPYVHSFVTLALVLAPFLLVTGVFYGMPGGIKYLNLVVPFCGSLMLTKQYAPNFESFTNANIAQFVGIAGALAATRIAQQFSAQKRIRSVMRATYLDIALIAQGQKEIERDDWMSLMVDRIGLLAPYVDLIKSEDRYRSVNAMLELRTGLNVIHLKSVSAALSGEQGRGAQYLLQAVGEHFRSQARTGEGVTLDRELVNLIDQELSSFGRMDTGVLRDEAINALTGLRCNLVPLTMEKAA